MLNKSQLPRKLNATADMLAVIAIEEENKTVDAVELVELLSTAAEEILRLREKSRRQRYSYNALQKAYFRVKALFARHILVHSK